MLPRGDRDMHIDREPTEAPRAVRLGDGVTEAWLHESLSDVLPQTVPDALKLAQKLTPIAATLGAGQTLSVWETLATLSAHDLGVARAIEPHLDAAAILSQAGEREPAGTWGVYAAEGGPEPLRALHRHEGWMLEGVKPWCSLAEELEFALVTALTEHNERRLFAVDLRHAGVQPTTGVWHPRGLMEIPSSPVTFHEVPARPIGEHGWYLKRPGFWWGGVGVAACWFGGAVGIARTVFAETSAKQTPHALAHLGAIDTLLHACRVALADAAQQIDHGEAVDGRLLAQRVRGIVARSCEEIITRAGHATGPGPLTSNAQYAKQVADLQLYIRQHHGERDDESHGLLLTANERSPW